MSRFNETKKDSTKIVNQAGGEAFKMNKRMELASLVGTTFLTDMFYEKADSRLARLKGLVGEIVKEEDGAMFIAKLASYTRNKLHMRTMPLILLVELAKIHNGDNIVRRATNKVIQRTDEIAEALAYWKHTMGLESLGKKAISKQLRLGLADKFHDFDEYQFAKYKGNGKSISLRDAMFLIHPKPLNDEEVGIFNRIANDTLATPETWETKISATKGDIQAKAEAWGELIDNKKLGYMAMMRNLRNIIDSNLSNERMKKVADYLCNETAVMNSKQLPMRYLSAYKALKEHGVDSGHICMKAIEKAMVISAKNIAWFNDTENTLIACDVSGSMASYLSSHSDLTYMELGLCLGLTLNERLDFSTFGIFGEKWAVVQDIDHASILKTAKYLYDKGGDKVGHSTNGYKALAWATQSNTKFDKIVMFTDCQLYGGSMVKEWNKYKKIVNPEAEMVLIDLSGYGNTPLKINDTNVFCVSGWSDKIFDALGIIKDSSEMLSYVDAEEI